MIEIDKDVPMPSPYPYRKLEVGDSFFVADKTTNGMAGAANERLTPKRFTARTVTEGGVKGVRVWRTE